jgi:hypothetical protein
MTNIDQDIRSAQRLVQRVLVPPRYEFKYRVTVSCEENLLAVFYLLSELETRTGEVFKATEVVQYGRWFGAWGDGGASLVVLFSGTDEFAAVVDRCFRRLLLF